MARDIGRNLNGYKVIATKSTVPPQTGARVAKILREEAGEEAEFDVVSNPEFLREGSAIADFMRPDRVVIGADSERAVEVMKELYRPLYLIETPFIVSSVATAEMIKYASNAFLATKISFINEVANLCERIGADVHVVAKSMGLDGRIAPKFLHPGPGFGGSCFPKDVASLVATADEVGLEFMVGRAALEANARQRRLMVDKIRAAAGGLEGRRIGVLGLAFTSSRTPTTCAIARRWRSSKASSPKAPRCRRTILRPCPTPGSSSVIASTTSRTATPRHRMPTFSFWRPSGTSSAIWISSGFAS